MKTHSTIIQTEIGWVAIAATELGIVRTSLPEPEFESAVEAIAPAGIDAPEHMETNATAHPLMQETAELLTRYCAGESVSMDHIPVDHGNASQFTASAREACRTIPRGETRTYRWLGEQASQSPYAARAAGRVMATNPAPIIIPCHRVIGSNGKLHGFGGGIGIPLKARLLQMEGVAGHQG